MNNPNLSVSNEPSISLDNAHFYTGLENALEQAQVTVNGLPVKIHDDFVSQVREELSKPVAVRPKIIEVFIFPKANESLGVGGIELAVTEQSNGTISLNNQTMNNLSLLARYFSEYMEAVLP